MSAGLGWLHGDQGAEDTAPVRRGACATARGQEGVGARRPDLAILCTDRCASTATTVAAWLADLGCVAIRPLRRLRDLSMHPPDLAVLVGIPADLGPVLIELAGLRAEVDDRALPILSLGLADTEGDMVRLLAAGASEVLALAPRRGELRVKVRRLLSHKAERAAGVPHAPRGTLVCGRYLVDSTLGSGAYGCVYDAVDTLTSRPVALKAVSSGGAGSRERFLREAYTLASVRDPHLTAVHDVCEDAGQLLLVSDVVRGPTLRRLVLDEGPLSERRVVQVLRGLARALQALERAGLVHRDVKPANVILRGGDTREPVLVDFGLAKRPFDRAVSSAEFVMGTPGYMAPNVLNGAVPDVRSDLFSLGMVARFMLTGDEYRPDLFGAELVPEMLDGRVDLPAVRLPGLAPLLQSLTEPDPAQRMSSARDLLILLEAIDPRTEDA